MEEPKFGRKSWSDARRKHPRFRTQPLHDVALAVKGPYLRISNISMGGLGIVAEGVEDPGKEFSAKLAIGKEKFDVNLIQIFRNEDVIGCQFKEPSEKLQKSIEKYFETEILASHLNRIDSRPALNNGQDKVIFFHGQNNCELLINERNGQICYFSVVVLGNCIEVDPKGTLVAGERIVDKNVPSKNGVFLFKPSEKPDQHILTLAIRFILGIEGLTPEYRQSLVQIINDNSKQLGA